MSNWNKSKEKLDYDIVEPGVRELVRALNTCKYLFTISSCESHDNAVLLHPFPTSFQKPFHVVCEFKDASFLRILIKHIHFNFFARYEWTQHFLPETTIRFFCMPGDSLMAHMREQFVIILNPTGFHGLPSKDDLRTAAEALVEAVKQSIKEAEDIWEVKS